MSENKQMLGTFIAERRKALGITQKQLAEQLGITGKAVSKWETLDANPDVGLLLPLASALQVTADELLRGELDSPESASEDAPKSESNEWYIPYVPEAARTPESPEPKKTGAVREILLTFTGALLVIPALFFMICFIATLVADPHELEMTASELAACTAFSAVLFGVFTFLSAICFIYAGNARNRSLPEGFVRLRHLPKAERTALKHRFFMEYRGLRNASILVGTTGLALLLLSIILMCFYGEPDNTFLRTVGVGGYILIIVCNVLVNVLSRKQKKWFELQKIII